MVGNTPKKSLSNCALCTHLLDSNVLAPRLENLWPDANSDTYVQQYPNKTAENSTKLWHLLC